MAKLYFKFGAMGSSKTAQALMTKFNYEEKDKTVWLIKPAIDTRDDRVENGRRITEAKSRTRRRHCGGRRPHRAVHGARGAHSHGRHHLRRMPVPHGKAGGTAEIHRGSF